MPCRTPSVIVSTIRFSNLRQRAFPRYESMHASLGFLSVNISEDLFFTLPATTLSQKSVVIPYCGYN